MNQYPNWFANDGEPNFVKHVGSRFSGKPVRCLQIGAYTGDASVWMLNNILTDSDSVLIDVDTWEGSAEPEHYKMNWITVESMYDTKTRHGKELRKIIKYKGTSDSFFANNREKYDFIYIDGDHTAYGVIKDAIAAYECLNVGGVLAFDDYQWTGAEDLADRPAMAIDAFLGIYGARVEILTKEYQCWVKKVK